MIKLNELTKSEIFEKEILYPMIEIFRKKRLDYHLKEGDVHCLMYKLLSERFKDKLADMVRAEKELKYNDPNQYGECDLVLYDNKDPLIALELKAKAGVSFSKQNDFIKDVDKKLKNIKKRDMSKYAISFIPCKSSSTKEIKSIIPEFKVFKEIREHLQKSVFNQKITVYLIYLYDVYKPETDTKAEDTALMIRIDNKKMGIRWKIFDQKSCPKEYTKGIKKLYQLGKEFWRDYKTG